MVRSLHFFAGLVMFALLVFVNKRIHAQTVWGSSTGSAWLTGSNWVGSVSPSTTGWARFNANPTPGTLVGINMNGSTNNGSQNHAVGAIEVTSSRSITLNVENSSGSVAGILTLNGTTVNGQSNVILSNSSAAVLTFLPKVSGNKLRIALGGSTPLNIVTAPGTSTAIGSSIQIKDTITGSAPLVFLGGGTYTGSGNNGGLLRLGVANSFSGGIIVGATSSTYNSGVLQLDTNTAIANVTGNNITINPFSQLYLAAPSGAVFTVPNDTLILNGVGNGISTTYGEGALRVNSNNYTWSGPIRLASDATISVVGSTNSLTATDYVHGSGQLKKAGSGALVLSTAAHNWSGGTLITNGSIVVNSGSSIGNGDLIFGQVSTGTTTVTFNNSSDTVTNLRSRWAAISGGIPQTLVVGGSSTLTINMSMDTVFGRGTVTSLRSFITGTGRVIKAGTGKLTLNSAGNTFSGGLTVNAGTIEFDTTASFTGGLLNNGGVTQFKYLLSGTSPIRCTGGTVRFRLAVAGSNTASADTLAGGTFSTESLIAATVSLGTLVLTENSTILLDSTTAHQFRFAASNTLSWTSGKTLMIYGWKGTYGAGTAGTVGRIFVGTTNSGLNGTQLAQTFFVNPSGSLFPAVILSSGEIVPGPVTFYSKSSGQLDVLSTWGMNTDGTGASPLDFTSPYQTFNFRNGNTGLLSSAWTISGTNSKLVVDGTDLTITASNSITATIDVKASRTLTLQNTTLPTLGTLDDLSTIVYMNGASNLLSYTSSYGNIIFDGAGTGVTNTAGEVTFAGNLTLQNGAAINASSVNLKTIRAANQLITGNGNTFSIGNFTKTRVKNARVTLATNTPITVNGTLNMFNIGAANSFTDSGNTLTVIGNVTMGGDSLGYSLSGRLAVTPTSGLSKISGDTTSQATVVRALFRDVYINATGGGTVSLITGGGGRVFVKGNFTVDSTNTGNITFNSDTVNIGGDFFYFPTTDLMTTSSSTVIFNGTSRQNYTSWIPAGNTFGRFTINNLSTIGLVLYNNIRIGNTFTFANGRIRTDTNTVVYTATATAPGNGSATSYIIGRLSVAIGTSGVISKIFPIGDTTFSPLQIVSSATPSVGGFITVANNYGAHPALSSSYLGGTSYLNRWVSISNTNVVATGTVNLNWSYAPATDLSSGTDNTSYFVRMWQSDTGWINPGTNTGSATFATAGLLTTGSRRTVVPFNRFFKEYAVGIPYCSGTPEAGTASATPSYHFTSGASTLSVTGASSDTSYTYQWYSSLDNISYTAISGATAATYNTPTLTTSTYFRYKVGCVANLLVDSTTKLVSVLVPSPEVHSLSSGYLTPGDVLTLSGRRFNSTPNKNVVYFGGVKSTPSSGDTNSLVVTVPLGAQYGPITVIDTSSFQTGISGQVSSYPLAPFLPGFDTSSFMRDTIMFRSAVNFVAHPTGAPSTYGAAIADIDLDGKPDIVANNRDTNTIVIISNVMSNPGSGTIITLDSFQRNTTRYSTVGRPNYIKLADLDGDGKLDVIVANAGVVGISIFPNTTTTPGSPTFGSRVDIPTGHVQAVVGAADFDGDGKVDIAFTTGNIFSPSFSSPYVKILKNITTGSGTISTSAFQLADSFYCGNIPTGLTIADFDNDGQPDIAATSINDAFGKIIATARNQSTPGSGVISFGTPRYDTAGIGVSDVCAADFDGDGKQDLACVNYFDNTIGTLRNTTIGSAISFAQPVYKAVGTNPVGLAVADFDGDKRIDIAVSNRVSNTVSVLRNTTTDTNITFGNALNLTAGSQPTTMYAGDLNGDQYPDIVVGNQAENTVSVFQNYPTPRNSPITGPDEVCVNGTINLADATAGGVWTSSDVSRATISSSGVVTGLVSGAVTISYTVTVRGQQNRVTYPITVRPLPNPGVIQNAGRICPGSVDTLTNTSADPGTATWSSATPSIATINTATGEVTGVTPGTVIITYSLISIYGCGPTTDTAIMVVIPPVNPGTITGTTSFCVGTSSLLSSTGDTGGVWTSSNVAIATVNSSGLVTGIAAGNVTITYALTACDSAFTTASLDILPLPLPGDITGAHQLCVGANTALTDTPSGGSWSSSNISLATVSVTGVVYGVDTGFAVITYTITNSCGSATDTHLVHVITTPPSPGAITGGNTVCTGADTTLLAAGVLGGIWTTDNATIATVDGANGIVYGAGAGIVDITYTVSNSCGSSFSYLPVTVVPPPVASVTSVTQPCNGYSATIIFTGTSGATVSYSIDGGPYIDSTLTGGTNTLITAPISLAHVYLLHSVSNGYCATNIDTSINIAPVPFLWTGGVSANWHNPANWNCGSVPGAGDDVTIPYGTTYQPTLGATGSVLGITVDTATTITIGTGGSLKIYGTLANNGRLAGNGPAVMQGSSAQTVSGRGNIRCLEIDNTNNVTIASLAVVRIDSVLTLTAGSLYTNDSLVMNATGDSMVTARIAEIPSGSSVVGKVRVNIGVIGGMRRWRFIGHPLQDTISFMQVAQYIDITGTGGAANGFTTTATNTPSAFRYTPIGGNSGAGYDPGWRPISRISAITPDSNLFHRYQGIRIFIRGKKGEGLGYGSYVPSPVAIGVIGTVNQGHLVVPMVRGVNDSQEYNLFSNPYPAPVNIGSILHNAKVSGNIKGSAFYVWDASLSTGGQFVGIPVNTVSPSPYYLQVGGVFEVKAAHNGDTLVYNESDKGVSTTDYLLKGQSPYTTLWVYDNNYHPWDLLRIKFDDAATDAVDNNDDADKLMGNDLNFYSISAEGKRQTIDARPYGAGRSVPLGLTSAYTQDFILKAEHVSVTEPLYIHDKLSGGYTELKDGTEYRFTITKDKATQGDQRFELAMKPAVTSSELELNLSPNPATSEVTLTYKLPSAQASVVRIFDMNGVAVYSRNVEPAVSTRLVLPLGKLAAGVYTVEMTAGATSIKRKLVKD